jgi:toxin YoeB
MSYCYIEKLVDDIVGAYSRRINIQNQIVNQVPEDLLTVKKLIMWIHNDKLIN